MHPSELLYSLDHIWCKKEADGNIRLGITYYYQEQLKTIVYVELLPAGSRIKRGDPFGSIESSKASTDMLSPLSGMVVAVNTAIPEKPVLVNKDPYGQGWLLLVEPSHTEELKSLLSSQEYLASVQQK